MNKQHKFVKALIGIAFCATLALGGCGKKGDLYLPKSEHAPSAAQVAAVIQSPAAAAKSHAN